MMQFITPSLGMCHFGWQIYSPFWYTVVCLYLKNIYFRSSCCGTAEMNLTNIPQDSGLIPGLA